MDEGESGGHPGHGDIGQPAPWGPALALGLAPADLRLLPSQRHTSKQERPKSVLYAPDLDQGALPYHTIPHSAINIIV
jgi:hypothetical protein